MPLSLDEAVGRMLAMRPPDRFPDLEEAAEAVRRARDPQAQNLPVITAPAKPSTPEDLATGTRVGADYEVLTKLGQGGMAVVYAVRHLPSGSTRALKIARPEASADEALRGEHQALRGLDHPNIVHVGDPGPGPRTHRLLDKPAGDPAATACSEPARARRHPFHVYKPTGLEKRAAWERTWEEQRKEDAGLPARPEVPPKYGQGDFLKAEYFRLRGKLDVPKERFIAFTEIPGRSTGETLYGWAGWTPLERVKALLAMDEECEDQGIQLADRIALLDSAWRLLPDVVRDDAATGSRLKAELQAILGAEGPSTVLLDDWKKRFPPPGRARGGGKKAKPVAPVEPDEDDE